MPDSAMGAHRLANLANKIVLVTGVYLLSDAAAFITGADVPIDGGLTA